MALLACPECGGMVSDQAENCPRCGYPLLKTEFAFIEVYFNGEWMHGEKRLKTLISEGWQIVDTNEFVDDEGVEVTKYKLEKKMTKR